MNEGCSSISQGIEAARLGIEDVKMPAFFLFFVGIGL